MNGIFFCLVCGICVEGGFLRGIFFSFWFAPRRENPVVSDANVLQICRYIQTCQPHPCACCLSDCAVHTSGCVGSVMESYQVLSKHISEATFIET